MNDLTIVIPTYCRLDSIKNRLSELELINADCEIIILDNKSENISKQDYENIIKKYKLKISIIVNEYNIGAPANLIRAFEVARAEWVWIISDDDPLDVSSCKEFLSLRGFVGESVNLINGSRCCLQGKNVNGYENFLNESRTLSNIIQPAYNLYRRKHVTNDLHRIYHFSSCMCPQLFAARACLEYGDCYFYERSVISHNRYERSADHIQWSYLMGYAVFDISLTSMSITRKSRRRLKLLIYNSLPGIKVFTGSVLKLIIQGCDKKSMRDLLYIIYKKGPLKVKFMSLIGIIITAMPSIFLIKASDYIDRKMNRKVKVGHPL